MEAFELLLLQFSSIYRGQVQLMRTVQRPPRAEAKDSRVSGSAVRLRTRLGELELWSGTYGSSEAPVQFYLNTGLPVLKRAVLLPRGSYAS